MENNNNDGTGYYILLCAVAVAFLTALLSGSFISHAEGAGGYPAPNGKQYAYYYTALEDQFGLWGYDRYEYEIYSPKEIVAYHDDYVDSSGHPYFGFLMVYDDGTVNSVSGQSGAYVIRKVITNDGKVSNTYYEDSISRVRRDGKSSVSMKIFDTKGHASSYLESGSTDGWLNRSGAQNSLTHDFDTDGFMPDGYVYDETIGYPQNVVYTEDRGEYGKVNSRKSHLTWDTAKQIENAYVEIYADNFHTVLINKKRTGMSIFANINDGIKYSDGYFQFGSMAAVTNWAEQNDIDLLSLATQSYGTTDYYVRIAVPHDEDNTVHVGGWVRVDIARGSSTELPQETSTTGGFDENTGQWSNDLTSDGSYQQSTNSNGDLMFNGDLSNVYSTILSNIKDVATNAGQFGLFLSSVFVFIPSSIWLIIGASFMVALIMSVIKLKGLK